MQLIECHRRPVILEEARPDKEVYRTVTISRGIDERIILTEVVIFHEGAHKALFIDITIQDITKEEIGVI
jgi:hypothetical protein